MPDLIVAIGIFVAGILFGIALIWVFAIRGAKISSKNELKKVLDERAVLRDSLESERISNAGTSARLDEARKSLDDQRSLLDEAEKKFTETFKALSLDALKENTEEFKKFAESALKNQTDLGAKELQGKRELIEQSLEGMGKKLMELQGKFEQIGQGNIEKITEVSELLKVHSDITEKLGKTTEGLKLTLASSKKRGEWGERMAEDVIRLAGLVEGINYSKQKTLEHATGRPDFTFYLPNKLMINMDVKFPLDNYVKFIEAESDHDRKHFRDELVKSVRIMIRDVGSKRDYIDTAHSTVDYAIIFIPNEQVYSFINESDPKIMDESLRQKIILCSPFTLYAVLAVVRHAVDNFNMEQTASVILKHLGDFDKQWNLYKDGFRKMGDRLEAARKEYDLLDTTRTRALEKPLRKIEELKQQENIEFDEQPLLDD